MAQQIESLEEFNKIIEGGGKTIVLVTSKSVARTEIIESMFDKYKNSIDYKSINFIRVDNDQTPKINNSRAVPSVMVYLNGALREKINNIDRLILSQFVEKYKNFN